MHETSPELEDVARRHGGRRARGVHVSADRVNGDRVAAVDDDEAEELCGRVGQFA